VHSENPFRRSKVVYNRILQGRKKPEQKRKLKNSGVLAEPAPHRGQRPQRCEPLERSRENGGPPAVEKGARPRSRELTNP